MPKVIPADWAAIKTAYLRGFPPSHLAKQYNVKPVTIRQRAYREGWTNALRKAKDNELLNITLDSKDAGKAWQTRMHKLMLSRLAKLEAQDPNSVDDLRKVTEADDTVDKIARRTLGLDDERARMTINVAVLDPAHVGRLNAIDATCVRLPKEQTNELHEAEIDSFAGQSGQERDPGNPPFTPDI